MEPHPANNPAPAPQSDIDSSSISANTEVMTDTKLSPSADAGKAKPADLTQTQDIPELSSEAIDQTVVHKEPGKSSANAKSQPQNKVKIQRLGDFQLVKKLGEGGMGAVYLANQTGLDRKV